MYTFTHKEYKMNTFEKSNAKAGTGQHHVLLRASKT